MAGPPTPAIPAGGAVMAAPATHPATPSAAPATTASIAVRLPCATVARATTTTAPAAPPALFCEAPS